MHADVPQWLIQAYVRSVQSAGSPLSKEELSEACYRLIDTWSSSDRSFHGLNHVIDLLTRIETLIPETHEPALVRLAAWYHGIAFSTSEEDTYQQQSGENIRSSATAAEYHLKDLGVDPKKAARVAQLIRGLKRQDLKNTSETAAFHAIDVDELALRDAHLGTLAADPQRYKKYLESIAKEYAHIPFEDFLEARKKIVTKILARRQLFVTPLARAWDAQARQNLEAELERINLLLAKRAREQAAAHTGDMAEPAAGTAGPAAMHPESPDPTIKGDSVRHAERILEERCATAPVPDIPAGVDALLQASAAADAQEEKERQIAATRLAHVAPIEQLTARDEDLRSTMETCLDKADPGVRPIEPVTLEQKKQRRREEIAADMRRRIAERHKAAENLHASKNEDTAEA